MENNNAETLAWEMLKKEIHAKTGFVCSNYSDKFLQRRVATRLYALQIKDYNSYLKQLKEEPKEKDLLYNELTIHVTNFFRNKDAFDVFVAETAMELLKTKEEKHSKTLKIWSAGCSTGEEPYSIAMILSEILQFRVKDFNITILGTDLDQKTVNKAKEGIYEKEQLREAPQEYIDKYFELKEDLYYVKEEIKNLVKFEVGDILSDNKPFNCDIIFCRNTVIYFTTELKEKLYQDFYKSLNEGGFFVMGMTESLTGPAKELFKTFNNQYRIYKK